MKFRLPIPKNRSQQGHGLMLLMVFLSTAVMTIVSLQMMQVNFSLGAGGTVFNGVSAEGLAETVLYMVREDILSRLDAGTLTPGTYNFSGNITVPNDPANLAGSSSTVGSFTATIPQFNGNYYLVQVVTAVDNVNFSKKELMQITPTPVYDCAIVENAVLAGNITSLTDAQLIQWAQKGCMKKPAPSISAYAVTAGTGSPCGSGVNPYTGGPAPLNLGNATGTCQLNIQGTYTAVYLGSLSSSNDVNIYHTGGGVMEVHATNLTGTGGIDAYRTSNNTTSTSPFFVKVSSIGPNAWISGGTADDTISVTGTHRGWMDTGDGNDTVIIGTLFNGDMGERILDLGNNDDIAYIKAADNYTTLNAGSGNDRVYFSSLPTNGSWNGQAGNDIISCTDLLGAGGCTNFGYSWVYGGTENDIISIDGPVLGTSGGDTIIDGEAGYNIVYAKSAAGFGTSAMGCNETECKVYLNATSSATGKSLVVVGGNRQYVNIDSTGSGSVLLLKSGTTSGTKTYVCGSLFNDSATSCANFARILWY